MKELKIIAKREGIPKYYEMKKSFLLIVLSNKEKIHDILSEMKKKSTCEHGRKKYYCSVCGGSKFCSHKKRKDFCLKCSKNICPHGRLEYYCKDCDGKYICQHRKIKHQCKICLNERDKIQARP